MSTKLDVLYARNYVSGDKSKQTHWMNIGAAFESKDGKGYDINIYALPPPTPNVRIAADGTEVVEMTYRLHIRPPLPKEGEQSAQGGRGARPSGFGGARPAGGTRGAPQGQQNTPSDRNGPSDDDIPF